MSMHTPLCDDVEPLQARRRLPTMAASEPNQGFFTTAIPMSPSFAQFRFLLLAAVLALLGACASLPPPTGELAAAQQAVTRAEGADADQYAAQDIGAARAALAQAQAEMARGREDDARRLAMAAAADADLAYARSREALASAELTQRRNEIAELRQRLQAEDGQ